MRVFVAGATGVLGRRAVAGLVAAGHEVTAVARSAERVALVQRLGAAPATVDLFDADDVRRAVTGHDAVCNLATHIPPVRRAALPRAWRENDRIRTEVSRHLADASLAVGAAVHVQESIAFCYADGGDTWIDERHPVDPLAQVRSAMTAEANAARVTAGGGRGVVLRFAFFYGHDSDMTAAEVRLVKLRLAPLPGPDQYMSVVTTDDAASAVVRALDAPAGTYNVGDDEPLTRRAHFQALSDALGTKPARFPPAGLARLGGKGLGALLRSWRLSNTSFTEATGWSPAWPSAREGWAAVVAAMGTATRR